MTTFLLLAHSPQFTSPSRVQGENITEAVPESAEETAEEADLSMLVDINIVLIHARCHTPSQISGEYYIEALLTLQYYIEALLTLQYYIEALLTLQYYIEESLILQYNHRENAIILLFIENNQEQ